MIQIPPRFVGLSTLAVAAAVAAPSMARAAEPEPFGVRAPPRPVPAELLEGLTTELPPPQAAGVAKSRVFFLNYDGVTITYNGQQDDSSINRSQFSDFALTYAPYGQGNKRAASMQAVKADWAKYDVEITDTRPASGNYTMCVNSPTNPFGGGVLGVAPLDCNDNQARNVVFAYHSANDQYTPATQATTMSQEIAHAYGLEHVNEPNDVMNPYNAGGDPSFIDQCLTLDPGPNGILCHAQHNQFCNGSQNSHLELVWLFGQSAPDLVPPTVSITSPTNGAEFEAGSDIAITATASDEGSGVATVQFFVNNMPGQTDATEPYTQGLTKVPAGTYVTYAVAVDAAGNEGVSTPVNFTVVQQGLPDPDPDPDPDPTADPDPDPTANPDPDPDPTADPNETNDSVPTESDGDDSGDDDSGINPTFDSGPALPPGYGQEGEGACSVTTRSLPLAGLWALALLLCGRRRKS